MTQARVRKLTAETADIWMNVGVEGIAVSDLIDEASTPSAAMTVGFARLDKGAAMDISFPYDEVLVVTKGSYTVRTEQADVITAEAGEVIHLPAGSSNSSYANEDTVMVYVAAPPSVYAAHVAALAGEG